MTGRWPSSRFATCVPRRHLLQSPSRSPGGLPGRRGRDRCRGRWAPRGARLRRRRQRGRRVLDRVLRGLKTRGLHDVQLVISDAHAGLKAAIQAVLLGAAWSLLGALPAHRLRPARRRARPLPTRRHRRHARRPARQGRDDAARSANVDAQALTKAGNWVVRGSSRRLGSAFWAGNSGSASCPACCSMGGAVGLSSGWSGGGGAGL